MRYRSLLLLLLLTTIACRRFPPAERVVLAQGCGSATISTTKSEFNNAFTIRYEVFSAGALCVPGMGYAVRVVQPNREALDVEHLSHPMWMKRSAPADVTAGPDLAEIGLLKDGGPIFTAPAGEYVLILRYAVPPCGAGMFQSVCEARSERFVVMRPMDYVTER